VIGLCAVIAFLSALWSIYSVGLLPPSVTPRNIDVAAASTGLAVDRPRQLISDPLATEYDYESIHTRMVLLGSLMTSAPAMKYIARRAGLDSADITTGTRITAGVQRVFTEPDSERRADQIAGATKPYRIEVRPSHTLPTLDIYTQATSVVQAQRLANAVLPGMNDYLRALARKANARPDAQVRLDQLGPARGAIINGGTRIQIAGLTFVFVFVMTCLLGLACARARRRIAGSATPGAKARRRPQADRGLERACPQPAPGAALTPPIALAAAGVAARPPPAPAAHGGVAVTRRVADRAGDWPHTTRVLPWMIAFIMAIVWLVPFNDILLDVSLPIDLYLDRLVLPFIVAVWALVLATGGRHAPQLRMTWIHAAIGAVVAVACLSLVLEARALSQTLEFDLAIKKLTLLGSYVCLFVIVASVVRRSEVRVFMSYTLALAIICALGTILEYRFGTNVFYSVSDALLPGIFHIGSIDSLGLDEIGRRTVRGPTQTSLEVVAIMAMALPIALVRLLESPRMRNRLLYGLAVAVLIAATVATFRKTAFLAPISVGLTLAYYRRRELIKLAPLGVVLVLLIQVLSPGALSAVAGQLDRNRLGVTTVSDRTADYDAIRPDVWTNLALGRGYGSYEHTSYRILDMELLRQLIEGGVVGLLAYIMMVVAVVAVARRPIRARRSDDASIALAVAAAAVCFLVVSTLFDVMSFPHVPYVFLWMAALLAVTAAPRTDPAAAPEEHAATRPELAVRKELAWSS